MRNLVKQSDIGRSILRRAGGGPNDAYRAIYPSPHTKRLGLGAAIWT